MGLSDIFALLGGVALFLFGMNLMGDGLKKAAGSRLEIILYRLTSTPIKGIILGTGVTAVIQSSSATSVMVVGFVNSGMMKVKQAIGIIMGAIIGTSITGWIICLSSLSGGSQVFEIISTDTLTALVAVAGIILLMFTKKEANHNVAGIMLGFAVLMFGIKAMTTAVAPLRESEEFINLLTNFSNPIIGILIGLAFTCIIQSASAAVGILQALAITGAINFGLALPVIMGIGIGASVPVLLSALGASTNGKRTALIYLMVDTFGAILFSILFYAIHAAVGFSFMSASMTMVSIALLNTVYRAVIVLLLTPLIGVMERMVEKIIPDNQQEVVELKDVDRLEERFLDHPALAIEQTRITIRSMAALTLENLREAVKLCGAFHEQGFQRASELEGIVDIYEEKLGKYIVALMGSDLNHEQNVIVSEYMHTINDYERISDHSKNIAESAKEMAEKDIHFTPAADHEIHQLMGAVTEIVQLTVDTFISDEEDNLYRIEALEEVIDTLCDEDKLRHIERLQRNECTYQHGFVFNDMLTDMERIGDHCSNIAIAIRMSIDESFNPHSSTLQIEPYFTKYYNEYMEKYA